MKKNTKKSCLVAVILIVAWGAKADNRQQKDISKIVKELTYLIQASEQLQRKYRRDSSKIRFNYQALIEQLKATRTATKEYLNHELYELHTAPPAIHKPTLTRVKP